MKKDNLNIATIQSNLIWENPVANRAQLEAKILSHTSEVDVFVLPEMFTTGFTMNASQYAETLHGTTVEWMKDLSIKVNAAICGSIIITENERFYNTLIWVEPSGSMHTYSKKHLFRLSDEHLTYSAGENNILIQYKGWNIRPIICYDLRFPVWCRNRVHPTELYRGEYDVLLVVANWPERRALPWKTLTQARAIENLCYVVACNRVGEDANTIYHSGDSAIINPLGEKLAEASHEETMLHAELSMEKLIQIRRTYQFWRDADEFSIGS
jgi:predicted amidohydrolase